MAAYLFASPLEVHDALKKRAETALLDVREQGEFSPFLLTLRMAFDKIIWYLCK